MNPGETIGHYRIIEPLGKGGMGEVLAAEDTRLHRRVALKILPPIFAADPAYRQRFEREAQAVAALNHPNIVTIHSVEEDDGRLFLTMELVDGRPLSELIPPGGLPLERLLRIGIEVADAMAAAQAQGITHRDLKPGNVMVTSSGRAKVLDFGLAKLRDAEVAATTDDITRMASDDITGEGKIIGTVAYMSPEQAEGKAVDPRSDIFSLGVMLHEMATGERPFKGDTNVSILSSILKDTPAPVTDSNPGLPAELSRIVRRTLAKSPDRRYQTAADLRNELEDLKQDTASGVTSAVPPPLRRERRDRRRGPRSPLRWAAWALGGLAIAAAAQFISSRDKAGPAAAATVFTIDRMSRLTSTGTARMAAISPDGRYVVHVKTEQAGTGLWMRQTATASDVRIVAPADVRFDGLAFSRDGDFVYYSAYPGVGGIASLFKIPALGGQPARLLEDIDGPVGFSPDGTQIAFIRGDIQHGTNHLVVASADGSGARVLADAKAPDVFLQEAVSWSPDARTILATASSTRPGVPTLIYAIDAASGATETIGQPWGFVRDVQWLPGGRSFLVTGIDFSGMATTQIWQLSFPAGERTRVTNDVNSYIGTSLSADGRALATVQTATVASLYLLQGPGTEPRRLTTGSERADGMNGIAFMPDGRIVYTSTAQGLTQLWIADSDGSNERQLTTAIAPASSPSVSPDGRWIYYSAYAAEGLCLSRVSPDGSSVEQLTKSGDARAPLISPDGKALYFTTQGSGQPRLMKMPPGGGTPQQVSDKYFRAQSFSTDGTQIAGSTWDASERRSTLAIYSLKDGSLHVVPDMPRGGTFLPNGDLLTVQVLSGTTQIVSRALAGGALKPLAPPSSDSVYGAAVSADGHIVISRGQSTNDVVLIKAK